MLLGSTTNSEPTFRKVFFALVWPACLAWASACSSSVKTSASGPSFGENLSVKLGPVRRDVVVDGALFSPSSQPVVVQRIRWYWDYNISWTVEEGSTVKAGDPVVKLDPSTIQKDLSDKQTDLESAKLDMEEERIHGLDDIADAKATVTTNEFDLKKQKLLVTDSDSVSEIEKKKQLLQVASATATLRRSKEKVKATISRSERKLAMQKLKVQQVQQEVDEMQAGLAKTELKAAQDGIVIFPLYSSSAGWQKARPGGGVQVNTVVAEIANPHDLVAKIFVPEIDADGIAVGTPGVLTLDIAAGVKVPGKAKSIAGVPTTAAERNGNKSSSPADNVRQFEVMFELSQLPAHAMPGMTVQVTLTPTAKDKVLRVPTEALATAPLSASEKIVPLSDDAVAAPVKQSGEPTAKPFASDSADSAYVYCKTGNLNWHWQAVKLGAQSLAFAEVISGLKDGDEVKSIVW